MKQILMLILISHSAAGAEAAPQSLEQYFRTELLEIDNLSALHSEPANGAAFPLQDINVDISPSVSFGVAGFLSLTVSPEIDFVLVPAAAR